MADHDPIPVHAEAWATYRALRTMGLQTLETHLGLTYAYWGPQGLTIKEYQALWLYAQARRDCLTARANHQHRLALTYQRQAGVQARTLNRWVSREEPLAAQDIRWPDDFWMAKWSAEVTALYALMEADGRTLDTSPDVQARLARIAWRASE